MVAFLDALGALKGKSFGKKTLSGSLKKFKKARITL
jgi:hypothetical protein